MLAAGVVISAIMSLTRADIAYSLVLVWAYVGIAVQHTGTPLVANSALVGAGLILVVLIFVIIRKYRMQGAMQAE